jgi:hypothetical protein
MVLIKIETQCKKRSKKRDRKFFKIFDTNGFYDYLAFDQPLCMFWEKVSNFILLQCSLLHPLAIEPNWNIFYLSSIFVTLQCLNLCFCCSVVSSVMDGAVPLPSFK